jgi:hypothetical protein
MLASHLPTVISDDAGVIFSAIADEVVNLCAPIQEFWNP